MFVFQLVFPTRQKIIKFHNFCYFHFLLSSFSSSSRFAKAYFHSMESFMCISVQFTHIRSFLAFLFFRSVITIKTLWFDFSALLHFTMRRSELWYTPDIPPKKETLFFSFFIRLNGKIALWLAPVMKISLKTFDNFKREIFPR